MVSVDVIRDLLPSEEYDVRNEELSEGDIARRQKKLQPREGSYEMDPTKFSPRPKKARLYRADGSLAPVPLATYDRYLRKRDARGRRIFFVNPPQSPPKLESDPCPVKIGAEVCGKRMLDQFELIRHIMKKHGDRAGFYLTQAQIDQALGKVKFIPNATKISDFPSSAPEAEKADSGLDDGLVTVKLVSDEPPPIEEPTEQFEPVEEVEFIQENKPISVAPEHTCKYQGKFGRYDDTCQRCQDILAVRSSRASRRQ